MKLEINCRNIEDSNEVIPYIDHRIAFTFAGWDELVESLVVTVTELHAAETDQDKQCMVYVKPSKSVVFIL